MGVEVERERDSERQENWRDIEKKWRWCYMCVDR